MRNDFDGEELLQKRLKNKFPKFGNDIEEVDQYAEKLVNIFADAVQAQNSDKYVVPICTGSLDSARFFQRWVHMLQPLPTAEMRGKPLSENQSPCKGADVNGITALLNSLSHVPFYRITGGPFNIRLHPSVIKGANGIEKISALLRTYMQRGGCGCNFRLWMQRRCATHKGILKNTVG